MGLPAVRQDQRAARTRAPRLAVVRQSQARSARSTGTKRTRSSAVKTQAARAMFQTFAVLVVVAAVLGIGRVWLSVQAAEASMRADQLRNDIKSERYEGAMLEVRQSTLGSPSRIRAIAGKAMNMAPAGKVTYLDLQESRGDTAEAPADGLPDPPAGASADAPRVASDDASREAGVGDAGSASSAVARVVAGMMSLSAPEAQVLLVGDVGLTSAK